MASCRFFEGCIAVQQTRWGTLQKAEEMSSTRCAKRLEQVYLSAVEKKAVFRDARTCRMEVSVHAIRREGPPGELLVAEGLITPQQLEAMQTQKQTGQRLGAVLVDLRRD